MDRIEYKKLIERVIENETKLYRIDNEQLKQMCILVSNDIDNKLKELGIYSHIIDTKTGYPIKDFSSLTVYFPEFGKENYLSSVALAVRGREKAFAAIEGMKGAAAIWIDGEGEPSYLINDKSRARWEEKKSFFEKLGLR